MNLPILVSCTTYDGRMMAFDVHRFVKAEEVSDHGNTNSTVTLDTGDELDLSDTYTEVVALMTEAIQAAM